MQKQYPFHLQKNNHIVFPAGFASQNPICQRQTKKEQHQRQTDSRICIPVVGIVALHFLVSARHAQARENFKSGGRIGGRKGFAANKKVKAIKTNTTNDQPPFKMHTYDTPFTPHPFKMHTYVTPFTPHPYPVDSITIGSNGVFLLGYLLTLLCIMCLALWCWITSKK